MASQIFRVQSEAKTAYMVTNFKSTLPFARAFQV
jgi:hypothetical protein